MHKQTLLYNITRLATTSRSNWRYYLVDSAAIDSHFSFGTFFNIKQAHFNHSLLEIKEKHGLVHSISIDDGSSIGDGIQGLVGKQDSGLPLQCIVIIIIEIISARVERLLSIIPSLARFRQCLHELCVQGWIHIVSGVKVAQSILERRASSHSQRMCPCNVKTRICNQYIWSCGRVVRSNK